MSFRFNANKIKKIHLFRCCIKICVKIEKNDVTNYVLIVAQSFIRYGEAVDILQYRLCFYTFKIYITAFKNTKNKLKNRLYTKCFFLLP